jgi:hypothetical protein
VTFSITPTWHGSENVKLLFDAETTQLEGGELSVGVARGRTHGSDWSVSFTRKRFVEGSRIDRGGGSMCFSETACGEVGTEFIGLNDATLLGVEAAKYINFGTIARRAQIGIVIGGGVGWMRGNVLRRDYDYFPILDERGRIVGGEQRVSETPEEARMIFIEQLQRYVPLVRAELALGAIVAPGLKVRATGGVTFPGYHRFGLSFVYLIGG